MEQDNDAFELAAHGRPDYVPAVFARSMDEAEKYRELLDEHDIPAITDLEYDESPGRRGRISRGVPVLVPEALLDEASEVIAGCEDLDEFAPAAVEEEIEDEEDDELEIEDDDDEFELEDDDEDDEPFSKDDEDADFDDEEDEDEDKAS